jgi:CRISPR-associated endonuclease Csn1
MIITNREPKLAWHKNDNGVSEFRFIQSFYEMMMDFTKKQPELVTNGLKVPYDWTIYYLRKKALTEKISGEELAWVLLNFNQKGGYYQIRGEEDNMGEHPTKTVEYYSMKVVDVVATDNKKGKDIWYDVHLENGWIYRRPSSQPLDWVGKTKDFIITTDINEDGTPKINKYGEPKRSFRAPAP